MARRKNFLDGLLYVINTLTALALMLSYLPYYLSPQWISWFSLLGLAYPYLLAINLVFAVWWALRLKLKIILPVVAIALGFHQIPALYQWQGSNQVVADGSTLKVMSYNVRMLNHFKWLAEDDIPTQISKLIAEHDPDVLMLQEFRVPEQDLGLQYPHRLSQFSWKPGAQGLVIFSKYPLEDLADLDYQIESGMREAQAQRAMLDWRGKKIELINVHLASVGLEAEDYNNLSTLSNKTRDEIGRNIGKISGDLSRAFKRRALQIETIKAHVQNGLDQHFILGGDFNDPPSSYTYHQISEVLEDSFISAGSGMPRTYNRGPLPLRIDYLFYSSGLRCFDYQVLEKELSDHFPLLATFALR